MDDDMRFFRMGSQADSYGVFTAGQAAQAQGQKAQSFDWREIADVSQRLISYI
jgi:hypothetical protein